MSVPAFTFLVGVAIIVLIILLVVVLHQYINLPPIPKTSNGPDPNTVECSPDDVLFAWIQGLSNREGCQSFTNNYVIANSVAPFSMFEKNFIATRTSTGRQCCYFSNDPNQRSLYPVPWICIGNSIGSVYTLQELNDKPYVYNNGTITYVTPPCDDDDNCIGLIQYARDATSPNTIGLYKAYKYYDATITISVNGQTVINPGISASLDEVIKDTTIALTEQCKSLEYISYQGNIVYKKDQQIPNPATLPQFINDLITVFVNGGFYPIAGANPPLSQFVANSG